PSTIRKSPAQPKHRGFDCFFRAVLTHPQLPHQKAQPVGHVFDAFAHRHGTGEALILGLHLCAKG
ncbi:MAG: hypothetical protein D6732_19010, partial [Methanobacteriota archaeon]